MSDFKFLLNDGISNILLNDGTSKLLLIFRHPFITIIKYLQTGASDTRTRPIFSYEFPVQLYMLVSG